MKKSVLISSIIILIYMFTIPAYAANISDGFNVYVSINRLASHARNN